LLTSYAKHKTKVHEDGGSKPVWNQTFLIDLGNRESFQLEVYDRETLGADKLMGSATINTREVFQKERVDVWVSLDKKGKIAGQIHLIMAVAQQPPKFVNLNGAPKLNPDYVNWKPENKTSLMPNQTPYALPVVTNLKEYGDYKNAAGVDYSLPRPLQDAIATVQLPSYADSLGIQGDALQIITPLFTKYEIPLGMLSKLMGISAYQAVHFVIDDSGSMGFPTDSNHPNGTPMTRWEEAQQRVKVMIEIMAFVPTPPITISFLNRPASVELVRGQKHPHMFVNESWATIDSVFRQGPVGGTPFYEKILDSLQNPRFQGQKVIRYFFGDGEPNGGIEAVRSIIQLVMSRNRPQDNPITLVSCTNEDSQVEWMKQLEEAAPYVAEIDDFEDERTEIVEDQGIVFPFTHGFYLIALVVGAMNPYDLDAMDESIPFTKYSLDSMLGVQYTPQEYFSYFDCFIQTQQRKPIATALDRIKKGIDWRPYYNDFLSLQGPNMDIPAVLEFKKRLREAINIYR
jgi:hypothetical protein